MKPVRVRPPLLTPLLKRSILLPEGVVALLEPFIDTIVICTITALVVLSAGVWKETTPTSLRLSSGDLTYVEAGADTYSAITPTQDHVIEIVAGKPVPTKEQALLPAWHEVPVETFFIDEAHTRAFCWKDLSRSTRSGSY